MYSKSNVMDLRGSNQSSRVLSQYCNSVRRYLIYQLMINMNKVKKKNRQSPIVICRRLFANKSAPQKNSIRLGKISYCVFLWYAVGLKVNFVFRVRIRDESLEKKMEEKLWMF